MAAKFKNLKPIPKCKKDGSSPVILRGEPAKAWILKNFPAHVAYARVTTYVVACPVCKKGDCTTSEGPGILNILLDTWARLQGTP